MFDHGLIIFGQRYLVDVHNDVVEVDWNVNLQFYSRNDKLSGCACDFLGNLTVTETRRQQNCYEIELKNLKLRIISITSAVYFFQLKHFVNQI